VALSTSNVEFVEGEDGYVRRSKRDQEGTGHVKGLPYGLNKETCPVTALRQWRQAAEQNVDGPLEGNIFRRFYRGESIGKSAMTAQYVSTVLKRHAESIGLAPEAYSAHFLRDGKAERRVREHSGHESWETFNLCARGGGNLSGQSGRRHRPLTRGLVLSEGIGLEASPHSGLPTLGSALRRQTTAKRNPAGFIPCTSR